MKKLRMKTNGERYILERIEHSLICPNGYITTIYSCENTYGSNNLKSKSFSVKNFYHENDIGQRLCIYYTIEKDGKCRITLIKRLIDRKTGKIIYRKVEHFGGDN